MAQQEWLDEPDLIAGLRARNPACLEAVIKQYSRELFYVTRLVLNGVGSAQDAEECLNDLFVVVWQEFDSFDPARSSLRTWLTMRAKYLALDKRRYIQRRKGLPAHSETMVVSLDEAYPLGQSYWTLNPLWKQQQQAGESMTAGIDAMVEERAQREEVRRALECLPELDRVMVYLRYFHHASIEEIAARIGITKHAVDTHLWRARKKLRKALLEQSSLPPAVKR
jgi:RNA polymerase sigma-70 factor (ECF subfamily)